MKRKHWKIFGLVIGSLLVGLTALAAADAKQKEKPTDDVIVINITGKGANAKYIKEGDTKQQDVEVLVGRTVRWVNKDSSTGKMQHTATSNAKKKNGNRVFQTKSLEKGESEEVKFDLPLYKEAVEATTGTTGDSVKLDYFCERHPNTMKSAVILVPPDAKGRGKGKGDGDYTGEKPAEVPKP